MCLWRRGVVTRETYRHVVREGLAIARAHAYALDGNVNAGRLLAGLLDHKPSLLQDYEKRRSMEVAKIVEAALPSRAPRACQRPRWTPWRPLGSAAPGTADCCERPTYHADLRIGRLAARCPGLRRLGCAAGACRTGVLPRPVG